MNLIFNFTNKYINIEITRAVAMAFPVEIDVNILSPKWSAKFPLSVAVISQCTKLLFMNNKSLINIGARAIEAQPKHKRIKLSFASFFIEVFIPAIIIL